MGILLRVRNGNAAIIITRQRRRHPQFNMRQRALIIDGHVGCQLWQQATLEAAGAEAAVLLADLARHAAVVVFPYSAYSISMAELYEMNMPFFVPSVEVLLRHRMPRELWSSPPPRRRHQPRATRSRIGCSSVTSTKRKTRWCGIHRRTCFANSTNAISRKCPSGCITRTVRAGRSRCDGGLRFWVSRRHRHASTIHPHTARRRFGTSRGSRLSRGCPILCAPAARLRRGRCRCRPR